MKNNIANMIQEAVTEIISPPPPLTYDTQDPIRRWNGWEFQTSSTPQGTPHARNGQIITSANPPLALAETIAFAREMTLSINNPSITPRWLTFLGPSGLGKSHLSRRAIRYHNTKLRGIHGHSRFIPWLSLLDQARNRQWGFVEDVRSDWFVCVDDLAAAHETDFSTPLLFDILSSRIGKWTVLSSNRSYAQFAALDSRIASRLIRNGNRVIEMTGKDHDLMLSERLGDPTYVRP